MKIIEFEEIKDLYKKCGLSNNQNYVMRTDLNMGTLNNKLNSSLQFLSKEGQSFYSNSCIPKKGSFY